MKERRIIAAVDENNGLGYNGDLLFKIPEDLKRFKALTTGNIVIMGRKTYESLGRPLPNRQNIVVTSKAIDFPPEGTSIFQVKTLKESYINSIIALLDKCDDISLLDLIKKLLEKSV